MSDLINISEEAGADAYSGTEEKSDTTVPNESRRNLL
jgi:hypothetical protein